MTNKEKVIEELTKRLLTEMACTRSEFRDFLKSHYPVVIEHLILVITQPNNTSINHWKGEIYGNFHKFEKLKYSKKYPTVDDFIDCGMESCFEEIEDQLESDIIDAFDKETDETVFELNDINLEINIPKLKQCIYKYFEWAISNVDPKTGTINKSDIYNKINELIKEYNP